MEDDAHYRTDSFRMECMKVGVAPVQPQGGLRGASARGEARTSRLLSHVGAPPPACLGGPGTLPSASVMPGACRAQPGSLRIRADGARQLPIRHISARPKQPRPQALPALGHPCRSCRAPSASCTTGQSAPLRTPRRRRGGATRACTTTLA